MCVGVGVCGRVRVRVRVRVRKRVRVRVRVCVCGVSTQAMKLTFNNNSSGTAVITKMLTCVRWVVRGSLCTANRRRHRRCPLGCRRSCARTRPECTAWSGPASSASGFGNRRACLISFVHISCDKQKVQDRDSSRKMIPNIKLTGRVRGTLVAT